MIKDTIKNFLKKEYKSLFIYFLKRFLWIIILFTYSVTNFLLIQRLAFYHLADEIWWKKYLSSYYFLCITMNTVGYGDVVPQNDIERIFCIFFIYIAFGLFAYTLNVVGNIIQQISKNKSQFLNNIMVINGYLNKKNINFDLRMRILKYLEYVWICQGTLFINKAIMWIILYI